MYSEIKKTYDALANDESKFVFRQKMLLSLTNDWRYMRELILYYRRNNVKEKTAFDIIADPPKLKGKRLIMFGTGGLCGSMHELFSRLGIEADFYCDNNPAKIGTEIFGRKIISADELAKKHRDAFVLITTNNYENEILAQLKDLDFPEENIIRMTYADGPKLYFDDDFITPPENGEGIFIDGGCFDGATSAEFLAWCGGKAKKIYAFEPDATNFLKCKDFFERLNIPCRLEQAGLYDQTTTLRFGGWHGQGARFTADGATEAKVFALDDIAEKDDAISLVKLDVEGAELAALNGMKETIRRHHPALAVCLYHKPEDIWDIPRFVNENFPEYKLYIRHYAPSTLDTVLYAVP